MSRIVLATASVSFEHRIRSAYDGSLNGELRRWRDDDLNLVEAGRGALGMSEDEPELVVLGPDVPFETAMNVAQSFDQNRPDISVVIVAEPSPELWKEAIRVGVRDVVSPSAPDNELRRAFDRAIQTARHRRSTFGDEGGDAGPTGKVITILSPKGGAGKTAVSSNLAVGLAAKHPGEVVLLDLDLQFGDLTHVLNLRPDHTIYDASQVPGVLDATTLKVFLTPRDGDLFVLCAPKEPAEGEQIPEPRLKRIIRLLAAEFRYVVIDTSAGLSEGTLAALEMATDLLLVTDLALPAAHSLRKVIEALDALGMDEAERHFVLNRADSKVGVDAGQVSGIVGLDIDVKIPSARVIPLSMNQGAPVIESVPRSPAARQMTALVDELVLVEEKQSGGILAMARRK